MNKFTSILAAALVCGSISVSAQDDDIRITPAEDPNTFEPTFKFNSDSKYYGIYLDEETRDGNLTEDQYIYVGPDEKSERYLDVWPDGTSVTFGTPSGVNSFGVPDSYNSLTVGSLGWSGIGYRAGSDANLNLSGITDEYTFHIAMKTTTTDPILVQLVADDDIKAPIVFGKADYDGNEPIGDFPRDGEWYNIDIPMSLLGDNFSFTFKHATNRVGDYFEVMPGKVEGTTVDFDAVFFYGPKNSTGVKGINTANATAQKAYYTLTGESVTADFAKANKGIYVVKQGDTAKKIVVE